MPLRVVETPKLVARPLRAGERDALAAALAKEKLASDDVEEPGRLFFRFETMDGLPVGFGGLEPHGEDGLLRSLVTLPPLRDRGFGKVMVAALEREAQLHGCRSLWLLTTSAAEFYALLGYAKCERDAVPAAIAATAEFATLCPASAVVMVKRLPDG
jgi:amino-acid N-acetyltransferase